MHSEKGGWGEKKNKEGRKKEHRKPKEMEKYE